MLQILNSFQKSNNEFKKLRFEWTEYGEKRGESVSYILFLFLYVLQLRARNIDLQGK